MKNKHPYLTEFLRRGMLFAGFGPIIAGIIVAVSPKIFHDGTQVLWAIVSTYLLAFIQAGASVFNQIEHWSLGKSLLVHFLILYAAYISCYILNTWIPFKPMVIVMFTAIFVTGYFIIWFTVYFIVKATERKLNAKL